MSNLKTTYVTLDVGVFGFSGRESKEMKEETRWLFGNALLNGSTAKATVDALSENLMRFYEEVFGPTDLYSMDELDKLCPRMAASIKGDGLDSELVRYYEERLWTVKNPVWKLTSKELHDEDDDETPQPPCYSLNGSVTFQVAIPDGVDEETFLNEFHTIFVHWSDNCVEWGWGDLGYVLSSIYRPPKLL